MHPKRKKQKVTDSYEVQFERAVSFFAEEHWFLFSPVRRERRTAIVAGKANKWKCTVCGVRNEKGTKRKSITLRFSSVPGGTRHGPGHDIMVAIAKTVGGGLETWLHRLEWTEHVNKIRLELLNVCTSRDGAQSYCYLSNRSDKGASVGL